MVRQIILTSKQQQAVANGNTVFVFDSDCRCIAVLLGYSEQDGVPQSEIEAAEVREMARAGDR